MKKYIKPHTEVINLHDLGYLLAGQTFGIGSPSKAKAANTSGGRAASEYAKENTFADYSIKNYNPWED